jgi:ABC-type sugar transport system ATPase subunit
MNLIQISGVIAGFRPEHFRLNDEVKESAKLEFKFRVENVEYLGAEFIVSGILVGGPANEKKVIARLLLGRSFEIGSTYDFAVAERDLKFFDATTDKKVQMRALSWQ